MRSATLLTRLTVGAIVVAGARRHAGADRRAAGRGDAVRSRRGAAASSQAPATARGTSPTPSRRFRPGGIATFGDAGVAVVGNAGAIVVSTNGGTTWNAPRATGAAADLDRRGFSDASHGWAVGAAGTIIATTDGGATWNSQTANAKVDLSAVDLGGVAFSDASHGWAVGTAGTIIATTDGGATWNSQTANATVDLSAVDLGGVAFSDASHGWAVGAAGTIIATTDGGATWNQQTSPTTHNLFGAAVLGSPQPQLLVGGEAGLLERMVLSGATWTTDAGPLTGDIVSCAAGPGGVAYALSLGGHVERTLSYGAVPLTLSASSSTLTAAHDVEVTAASSIWAPGTLVFEEQSAGGAWQAIQTWASPWTSFPIAASEDLTTSRCRRPATGCASCLPALTAASAAMTVGVRPEIILSRTSLRLRRGAVYRLSGQVWPARPGGKVTIWTNRGGAWHRIASGGVVGLVGGSTFATRRFGTPVRQSYELQVRLAANASHLAAKSAMVKVTIR